MFGEVFPVPVVVFIIMIFWMQTSASSALPDWRGNFQVQKVTRAIQAHPLDPLESTM